MIKKMNWINLGQIGRSHSLKGRAHIKIDIFNLDLELFKQEQQIKIGPISEYAIPSSIKIHNLHKNIFNINIFELPGDVEKFTKQQVWIQSEKIQKINTDLPFCFELESCELISPDGKHLTKIDHLDHNMLQPNIIFANNSLPLNQDLFEYLTPQNNKIKLNTVGYSLYCEL